MKRFILFLLIGALLVLPLSGCFADNKQNEGTTPNNTTPEATTPEVTTPEATTPPENNQDVPPLAEGELDKSGDLVSMLVAYLEQYYYKRYIDGISLTTKINEIKKDTQPLLVAFDPNHYYYVAGYYNATHEYRENYCCASEYTWIKYENEAEIQEFYNGMECVVAFQMNRTSTITDILSNETDVPDMEHFQIYQLTFENGSNTNVPIVFDQTFIYLNHFPWVRTLVEFNENTIYHCETIYYDSLITIPCVCIAGEYYLSFYLTTLETGAPFNIEEILSNGTLVSKFDDYYNTLISITDFEKYSVSYGKGNTHYYGVISIEDFVNQSFAEREAQYDRALEKRAEAAGETTEYIRNKERSVGRKSASLSDTDSEWSGLESADYAQLATIAADLYSGLADPLTGTIAGVGSSITHAGLDLY